MRTPPALIAKVIEQHNLDVLQAWDTNERLRLYHNEGSSTAILDDLQMLVRSFEGSFLVKAWKKHANLKGGRKPETDSTYSWIVQGGKNSLGAIGQLPEASGQVPTALLLELATLRVEKQRRDQDDREPVQEEPESDPTMGKLVDVLTAMLLPKAAAPAPAPVAGSERGHPSALTNERMAAILRAVKVLHATDPAAFAQYEAALIAQYGPGAKTG